MVQRLKEISGTIEFKEMPLIMLYVYPMILTDDNHSILESSYSPVINHKGFSSFVDGGEVMSCGSLQPVGYRGKWNLTIDLYGQNQLSYLDHINHHINASVKYEVALIRVFWSSKVGILPDDFQPLVTDYNVSTTYVNWLFYE